MTGHTRDLLLIAVGGAVGAVGRHSVGRMVGPASGGFHWHTLIINVSGSFALGLLLVIAARQGWPGWWRPLLGIGLLGGYTTFSTFSLESAELILQGSTGIAASYMFISATASVAGALAGIMLGRAIA